MLTSHAQLRFLSVLEEPRALIACNLWLLRQLPRVVLELDNLTSTCTILKIFDHGMYAL